MSSNANASFQYQIDLRGSSVSVSLANGQCQAPSPRYGIGIYHRPYGWKVTFPMVKLAPGTTEADDKPLVRVLSTPVSRVSVWLMAVVHSQSPLPALSVKLRPSIVAGGADTKTMPVIAPKGLATLEDEHLIAQQDGFTAEEWDLWGHVEGVVTSDIFVSFGMIGGPSACCQPTLFQP